MPRINSIRRPKFKTIEELLDKRIPDRQPGQCWLWTGTIMPNGYGLCGWQYKRYLAHRLIYEHLIGAIPKGLEIDHLCRTRHCVNPAHLEPVTHAENMRRGKSYYQKRTHCIHGHPYDAANTYIGKKGYFCRVCGRQRTLAYLHRKKSS